MCQNSPSCQHQKACATVTHVAGDTCQMESGKAGDSAVSTVTSSSKKGKGRGVCSMQSQIHPSALLPWSVCSSKRCECICLWHVLGTSFVSLFPVGRVPWVQCGVDENLFQEATGGARRQVLSCPVCGLTNCACLLGQDCYGRLLQWAAMGIVGHKDISSPLLSSGF